MRRWVHSDSLVLHIRDGVLSHRQRLPAVYWVTWGWGGQEDGSQECFVRHSHPGWLVRSPTLSQHVTYFSQQDNCVCTCPGFTFQLLFLCKQWSQKRNLGIEQTFDWVLAHVFKPKPCEWWFHLENRVVIKLFLYFYLWKSVCSRKRDVYVFTVNSTVAQEWLRLAITTGRTWIFVYFVMAAFSKKMLLLRGCSIIAEETSIKWILFLFFLFFHLTIGFVSDVSPYISLEKWKYTVETVVDSRGIKL